MTTPEKHAEITRIFNAGDAGEPDRFAAGKAGEAVMELCTEVNLASYMDEFREVPDRAEYLEIVPKMAQDAIDSGSPANNRRKPTVPEIEDLNIQMYDDTLAPDSVRRSG